VAVFAAEAQPFTYTNNDLLLGFRKTGSFQETYEAVVNIGKVTNYTGLPAGSSISVPNFSLSQLTPDSFSSLNDLSWSVFAYALTNTFYPLPGYVNNTLWLTVPRTDNNVQSTPPNRLGYIAQRAVGVQMNSIGGNGRYLSSQTAAGPDNTTKFIREPVNNSSDLSAFISSSSDSTASTFRDTWSQNVEIMTPDSFSGSVRADLYEVRPLTDAALNPVVDPHTGSSGVAFYVGFFEFKSNGTMTFTREPPTFTAFGRNGNVNTLAFTTTGATNFTLYHTNNLAGLGSGVSTWAAVNFTLPATGNTNSVTDTTTDSIRFYRISAH
jgi:hypothetical protein